MSFDWVKFEEAGKRHENRITITKGGTIGFPTQFYNQHGIKAFKYVILYFSPTENAIGIELSNDETERSKLRISHSDQGYGASVNARTFFRFNNIDYIVNSGKYEWSKDSLGEKGLFVIRLKKVILPETEGKEAKTGPGASEGAVASTMSQA